MPRILFSLAAAIGLMQTATAAGNWVWTGKGADQKWSTVANWSVDGVAATTVPGTDAVVTIDPSLKGSAVIDLNGQTVAFASFAGAGEVKNGTLKTSDNQIVQDGGALTVPAVKDMVYVAWRAGYPLKITSSDASVAITISVPKAWFAAGGSGYRMFYSGTTGITWSIGVDGVAAKSEKSGWWSIENGGFVIKLR